MKKIYKDLNEMLKTELSFRSESESYEIDMLSAYFNLCLSQAFSHDFLDESVQMLGQYVKGMESVTVSNLLPAPAPIQYQEICALLSEYIGLPSLRNYIQSAFDKGVNRPLDSLPINFDFIPEEQRTEKKPQISEEAFRRWLLNHLKLCSIEDQLSYWNGREYVQGDENVLKAVKEILNLKV